MDKENLENINIDNLLFYLERSGWNKKETRYSGLFVYVLPDKNIELVISKTLNSKDYFYHLNNSIDTLSKLENKNSFTIIRSIKNLDRDLHNLKVLSIGGDSIPIGLAEQIISSARSLFEQSAKKEVNLNPKYIEERKLNKTEVVNNFINSCQFTHTWKGSFGFTIEAPLSLPSLGLIEDIPENYERKISKRIFTGMNIINEAVTLNSYSYIVDNVERGFDGKMCYALVDIAYKLKSSSLDYNTLWSPTIKIDDEVKEIKNIHLDKRSFDFAEKAAEQLYSSEEELRIWFTGFPEGLKSQKEFLLDEEIFGERFIYVKGSSKEIGYYLLKMELDIEDYRNAIKAHREGKDVRVDCLVHKKVRGWDVKEVYEFNVLD